MAFEDEQKIASKFPLREKLKEYHSKYTQRTPDEIIQSLHPAFFEALIWQQLSDEVKISLNKCVRVLDMM